MFLGIFIKLNTLRLSKADFAVDFDDVHNITPVKNLAGQIQEGVYNIYYLAGDDAYHWMLDYYHAAKQAAARDVPKAGLVAGELGKRFYRPRRKSKGDSDE